MLCVVYVCDDRNIHTRAYTHIVHRIALREEFLLKQTSSLVNTMTLVDSGLLSKNLKKLVKTPLAARFNARDYTIYIRTTQKGRARERDKGDTYMHLETHTDTYLSCK